MKSILPENFKYKFSKKEKKEIHTQRHAMYKRLYGIEKGNKSMTTKHDNSSSKADFILDDLTQSIVKINSIKIRLSGFNKDLYTCPEPESKSETDEDIYTRGNTPFLPFLERKLTDLYNSIKSLEEEMSKTEELFDNKNDEDESPKSLKG